MLSELVEASLTDAQIAEMTGFDIKTVESRRGDFGIHKRALKNSTPDEVLKEHVLDYLASQKKIRTGVSVVSGYLRSIKAWFTREQLRKAMRELHPPEYENRASHTIQPRVYTIPFINSLWHIDGHMKLIKRKIAIHGGIDGKSHMVTYLGHDGAGLSGSEPIMGERTWGRKSRSFHNGKVFERLWVDVRNGFVDKYIRVFNHMELADLLNSDDPVHLYCLHHVYMPLIRDSASRWVNAWNYPVRSRLLLISRLSRLHKVDSALAEEGLRWTSALVMERRTRRGKESLKIEDGSSTSSSAVRCTISLANLKKGIHTYKYHASETTLRKICMIPGSSLVWRISSSPPIIEIRTLGLTDTLQGLKWDQSERIMLHDY
ncbi:hypothetical protein QFC24_002247 [Naganishia onofrii]|uniref:Uncharacterized protein n=1 Tax=Naganishia onofrii TaxID=1851511 RepID=A0ACC2XQQ7_9TREE|nr:hypothetical protein QFC24_002247 [Naganishia onofrii]